MRGKQREPLPLCNCGHSQGVHHAAHAAATPCRYKGCECVRFAAEAQSTRAQFEVRVTACPGGFVAKSAAVPAASGYGLSRVQATAALFREMADSMEHMRAERRGVR